MKKSSIKTLRRLLCFGLILTLMLSPAFSVFATDEISEEQDNEGSPVNELSTQEAPPVQHSASPEAAEPKSPEPASEDSTKPAAEEAPEAAVENADAGDNNEQVEPVEVSEESSVPEQAPAESAEGSVSAPAVTAPSAETNTKKAVKGSSSGPIHIGNTAFTSEDDESSQWSDGKGWKNVAGKYIAMVDYDGSKAEVSADGGVVALAVAGVNRIGKLTGNCSYQISGTGIVLIDSIEIEDGNTVTLHPDMALYKEGSAAVFLRQNDDSYMLINGSITGILDEVYELDNINLVLPKGSSLTISAAGVRKETWDDEHGTYEDITFYLTDLPYDANERVHDTGQVEIKGYIGNVVLGKNSTLTINEGASVQMKKVNTGSESIEAELIVQGILNVLGIVEGGFIDINNSGSVTGNGTIRSAELDLDPEGNMSADLLLNKSALTINGDRTITPPMLKDSTIYLKGSDITIPELNVSGVSLIGVNTIPDLLYQNKYNIRDINVSSGSSLKIICNDHPYGDDLYSRLLEDSYLEISGKITGGPVDVLGGGVWYTGNQTEILPAVPDGYASRVFVAGIDTKSSLYPLNMTADKANELLTSDEIPFTRLTVNDSLISKYILESSWFDGNRDILGRAWDVSSIEIINTQKTIDREKDLTFTCASFLEHYGMTGMNSPHSRFTAVEVIRSDLTRERFFLGDTESIFNLNDAIMVRVLDCMGQGGQGGSAATHTNAAFTGNGVIGGTGSGSVQAGSGTVVFGKASYTEPEPDPSPKPEHDNTVIVNTDSSGRTTVSDSKENIIKTVKANTGKSSVSSAGVGGLVVTVSPVEQNTEEQGKADPKFPQIWHLDVTNAGVPVTDLSGNPVTAVFPFNVPESWGDPANIANDNLYAVFADENGALTAYSAKYDPESGEVMFESEQTGDFVIVRFAYEDEPFTEDFYRALGELEEIQLFLSALRE